MKALQPRPTRPCSPRQPRVQPPSSLNHVSQYHTVPYLTHDDFTLASSSDVPIIAGVVGGLISLAIIATAVIVATRKSNRRTAPQQTTSFPLATMSPSSQSALAHDPGTLASRQYDQLYMSSSVADDHHHADSSSSYVKPSHEYEYEASIVPTDLKDSLRIDMFNESRLPVGYDNPRSGGNSLDSHGYQVPNTVGLLPSNYDNPRSGGNSITSVDSSGYSIPNHVAYSQSTIDSVHSADAMGYQLPRVASNPASGYLVPVQNTPAMLSSMYSIPRPDEIDSSI